MSWEHGTSLRRSLAVLLTLRLVGWAQGSGNSGKPGKKLRLEDLQSQFGVGLKEAASRLGICATTLKRACRWEASTRHASCFRMMHSVFRSARPLH